MTKPETVARTVHRLIFASSVAILAGLVLCPLARSQAVSAVPAAQHAQPAASVSASSPTRPPATHATASMSRGSKGVAVARPVTRPLWRELPPVQQQALAPLSAHWDTLSEPQKRKWIALSANFPKLSGEEQAKLHSRMTEWVSLSPQQRTIARLNYSAAQKLSPDDKKAKWEAYQALSPEEKKKLAARAAKPPSTAAALRPVPAERLATLPKQQRPPASKTPRIAAAPNQVDHRTLLPQYAPPLPYAPPQQAGTPD